MNNTEEKTEETTMTPRETVFQEMSKIIGRYGIEMVLESFIELTSPSNNMERPEIADLQSRLVVAMNTYRKSYETRQKKVN